MRRLPIIAEPRHDRYDVVIVGGAVMGSSIAWWLAQNPDFDGSVLVLDRDHTYEFASTSHTNSCMRQQFSNELNVRISQFGADFVRNFGRYLGGDPAVPKLSFDDFGYLYLADTEHLAGVLRASQKVQERAGAKTRTLTPTELGAAYPFYRIDDIVIANLNLVDEGYFDGGTMFAWLRNKARDLGAEYIEAEVTGIDRSGSVVTGVVLASGRTIACGTVVNASGPRAVETARMAGLELAVEPRKRFTFVFDCAEPPDQPVPLTVDPSGVHVRSDCPAFMAGCAPDHDPAVSYDDFAMDHSIFEDKVWPALANRIPAFERIKVTRRWAGHYAYNLLDQNAVVGPHPSLKNFIFGVGFSGHGLQQAPATGRGISELVTYGEYRSLDMTALGYDRLVTQQPFLERAVI